MRVCSHGGSIAAAAVSIMQVFWNDELLDLSATLKRLNGNDCYRPLLSNSMPRCHSCARVCFELLLTGAGASAASAGSTTRSWQLAAFV